MIQRHVVLDRVRVERQHWEDVLSPLIPALLELAEPRRDANTIRSHTSLSGTSHTLVRAVKHVAHTWREGGSKAVLRSLSVQGSRMLRLMMLHL